MLTIKNRSDAATQRFPRLLAKSSHNQITPHRAETLIGHTEAVLSVAGTLVTSYGQNYLAALGLEDERHSELLRASLLRGALLHDLAKASSHFQRMVRQDSSLARQALRHDQLSIWLLLSQKPLETWLFSGLAPELQPTVRNVTLSSVLNHHLKYLDGMSVISPKEGSGDDKLTVHSGHPDFFQTLVLGAKTLGLPPPPALTDQSIDFVLDVNKYSRPLQSWIREASRWWTALDEPDRRLAALVRALLIASDVGGSALPKEGQDPASWTTEALDQVCTPAILGKVIQMRLGSQSPRPFQCEVEKSPARVTFVRAGCGSGKTAAAYLWAKERAVGKKLFFCYPTTGTASQGFDDYVPPDEFESALIHSRAPADLERLLGTPGDAIENREIILERLDRLIRYSSLMAWSYPLIVCTVDSVLGLLQNNRTGLYSSPAIANGAFIFDEIHQYDDRLFGALLRFLSAFRGAPILLMTASLPESRLQRIAQRLEEQGESLKVIAGPPELQSLKRYILRKSDNETAWREVVQTIAEGKRVLWVANTVNRAIGLGKEAKDLGLSVKVYHSRFRYEDRLERHEEVISGFSEAGEKQPMLAITTQVCEVSLDISADLMVSDLAPIPSLIQRLGRLNRRASPANPGEPGLALILQPDQPAPYSSDELNLARIWLGHLQGKPTSQADLDRAFEETYQEAARARSNDKESEFSTDMATIKSSWLDDGVIVSPAPLREAGTSIPVIREEDSDRLKGLFGPSLQRELIRLTLPMPLDPVQREVGSWERVGGVPVAPMGRIEYSEEYGGRWSKDNGKDD